MKNYFAYLILLLLVFPATSSAQDGLADELSFEVNRVLPYLSITKEELSSAQTLVDLDWRYKPSWVREYISVEIMTCNEGKIRKTVAKNDALSQEQKDNMNSADTGTEISVVVRYLPENTLKHNDAKELNFTFTVDPENQAAYPGGQQQLISYLKVNAIDKIPDGVFTGYDFAAIKFTVDKEGAITDVHLFESSKDEKIDELLLQVIRNMPRWKPASYGNGVKVNQEFALTVGNMENCMVNLLSIRRLNK